MSQALLEMYEHASVPVAFLDRELHVQWANQAAIDQNPPLAQADGLFLLLPASYSVSLLEMINEADTPLPEQIALPFTDQKLLLLPVGDRQNPEGYLLHKGPNDQPGGSALHPDGTERLISAFSNQFRAPLSSIYSTLSVLRSSPAMEEFPELGELLQNINENSYKMLRSSANMTEYIRQQSQAMELRRTTVDFGVMLRQLCEAANIVTGHIGIVIECEVPEEEIYLSLDESRVSHAILQLIANSCRFTRDGNRILISARQLGSQVVVTVRDWGLGIPGSIQDMVFDPYFSYDPMGAPFAGLGLGLTLFKYIIGLHKGSVALSSQEDEGTTVVFTLPVETDEDMTLSSPTSVSDYLYDRFSPVYILLSDSCPPPKP